MPPNNTKKLKTEPIVHQVKKPSEETKTPLKPETKKKPRGFSGTGRLGLFIVAIAFAINKIYPVRHEMFRKIFYP